MNHAKSTSSSRSRRPTGVILAVFAALALGGTATLTAVERPPNLVVFFVDNLGYGDTGPFADTVHRTPRLDRMAAEGMKLTHFYVAANVCTPSRAALMTGCYPRRVNLHEDAYGGRVLRPSEAKGLHPEELTLAKVLQGAGYATALYGKWHLGDQSEFLPTRQGFDEFFGIPHSDDMTHDHPRGEERGWPPLPLLRNEEVIEAPVERDTLVKRCFDLSEDPAEETDLAAGHPGVVKRLAELADRAREDLGDGDRPGKNQRSAGWVESPRPLVMRE